MENQKDRLPRCADCTIDKAICSNEDGQGPGYCPTLNMTAVIKEAVKEYKRAEINQFALNATIQEGECYVNRGKDNPHVRYAINTDFRGAI